MLREIIYKLGSNNKNNLRWFLTGMLLFAVSGGFIALGYYYQYWYQIIGMVIAVPAVILMGYGYLRMLANRFAQIWKRLEDSRDRRKSRGEDL
ncbi:MAG: hypothetical protein HRT35_26570 [Algicola sp.]|nr:hypothetical protein [Algicola sp.]